MDRVHDTTRRVIVAVNAETRGCGRGGTPCRASRWAVVLGLVATLCAGAVADAKPLRVGASGDYAPFSLRKEGKYEGLDAVIANRLAKDLGYSGVEFVKFAWPELEEKVRSGAFDVALSGITSIPERTLVGRYTRPYAATGAMLLIRTEDQERFASVPDVDRKGVRIAVNKGGYLERLAWRKFLQASIQPVSDNEKVPRQVLLGSVDAALTDSAEVLGWLRWEFRTIGPFTRDYKAMLLPPDRDKLADRIDAWLVAREEDGWLQEQRKRFLGEAGTLGADVALGAACELIRLRMNLMPMVGAAKRAQGLPVQDAAQEQRVMDRIRAWSKRNPERTIAVFEQVIGVARAIQLVEVPAAEVPLEQLRAAIERIDRQLVREIERSPPSRIKDWKQGLERLMELQAIREEHIMRLAVALALPENLSVTPPAVPNPTPQQGGARNDTP